MSVNSERVNSYLKKAKEGDATGFVEFYNYTYPYILKYVLGIVKNTRDAEDIVCDTMDKIYTHLSDFDESKSGYAWAITIAKNTALDFIKKNKEDTVDIESLANARVCDGFEDDLLIRYDIEKNLESFDDYEKTLFSYLSNKDITYQEISEQVGKPLVTVYRGVQKVRNKMKELLSET